MMCRRTGTIVALLAAGTVAADAAAQGAGDAGAAESTPAAAEISWWWLAFWCALAVAAIVAMRRVAWFRQLPRIGPAWPLRAEASVLGFGAAFMGAALGAVLLVRAAPDSGGDLARATLQAAGGHAAQLAVVAVLFSLSSAPNEGWIHAASCGTWPPCGSSSAGCTRTAASAATPRGSWSDRPRGSACPAP
ncbi:MAG: hypothetical protein ACKOHI_10455 [Phycisphaerales bacterium]